MTLGFWSIATLLVCVPFLLFTTFYKIQLKTAEQAKMTGKEWYRSQRLEAATKKGEDKVKELLDMDEDEQESEFKIVQGLTLVLTILFTFFHLGFYGWLAGFFLYTAGSAETIVFKGIYLLLVAVSIVSLVHTLRASWKALPSATEKVYNPNIGTIIFGRTIDAMLLIGLLIFAYTAIFA